MSKFSTLLIIYKPGGSVDCHLRTGLLTTNGDTTDLRQRQMFLVGRLLTEHGQCPKLHETLLGPALLQLQHTLVPPVPRSARVDLHQAGLDPTCALYSGLVLAPLASVQPLRVGGQLGQDTPSPWLFLD